MNEFLKIMSELIKQILEGPQAIKEESTKKLQVCYSKMSVPERKKALESVLPFTGNDLETYVFLLSFVLKYINDEQVKNAIEDALADGKYPLLSSIVFSNQIGKRLFINKMQYDEYEEQMRKQLLHERHVKEVQRFLPQNYQYIPYENRNKKRVVISLEPILSERHAPTKKMINMHAFFRNLGYDVLVVATSYRKVELDRNLQWWEMYVDKSIYEETGRFEIDFLGEKIQGCHIAYTDEHFIEEIHLGMEVIREYNPEFVLMLGERGILADLCNMFTTTVVMPCVNQPAVTTSDITLRYFNCTEEKDVFYRKCLKEKALLDFRHVNILETDSDSSLTREQFGISEKDFVVIVAGTRLEYEISGEAERLLYAVLDENPDAIIAFIGKCENLQKRLDETKYAQRFRYMGYQENFGAAIGLGDVFLNPPRQGAGAGGGRAMKVGVPVITLGNCDVALVGESFICETLEEMPKLVKRYREDADFMRRQKEKCKEVAEGRSGINNMENLKKLLEEIKGEIDRLEKEHKDGR